MENEVEMANILIDYFSTVFATEDIPAYRNALDTVSHYLTSWLKKMKSP